MSTIFSIAGTFFVICLGVLLLCWAWSIVTDKLGERNELRRAHYRKEARHVWGQSIAQDAYWLSENSAAYVTMKAVGEALMNGGYDMMTFRDELYRKIREEEKQKAQRQFERLSQIKVGAEVVRPSLAERLAGREVPADNPDDVMMPAAESVRG